VSFSLLLFILAGYTLVSAFAPNHTPRASSFGVFSPLRQSVFWMQLFSSNSQIHLCPPPPPPTFILFVRDAFWRRCNKVGFAKTASSWLMLWVRQSFARLFRCALASLFLDIPLCICAFQAFSSGVIVPLLFRRSPLFFRRSVLGVP